MKEDIFVVVDVTYDYYRFQDNLFASTNMKDCYTFISAVRDANKDIYGTYGIFTYDMDEDIRRELGKAGISHFWIQKL